MMTLGELAVLCVMEQGMQYRFRVFIVVSSYKNIEIYSLLGQQLMTSFFLEWDIKMLRHHMRAIKINGKKILASFKATKKQNIEKLEAKRKYDLEATCLAFSQLLKLACSWCRTGFVSPNEEYIEECVVPWWACNNSKRNRRMNIFPLNRRHVSMLPFFIANHPKGLCDTTLNALRKIQRENTPPFTSIWGR
jgi:hypothetical protein